MTLDREALKKWYRGAMVNRLGELRELRVPLKAGEPGSYDAARAIAQALRGSGATFGYPDLSAAAGHVEAAPDHAVLRRTEGLIERLRRLSGEDESVTGVAAEWLIVATSDQACDGEIFSDVESAWAVVAERLGLGGDELARRVAELFGLPTADLSSPSRAALRLVPEALVQQEIALPLHEDGETILVATADPTSLDLEMRLADLTGRAPRFAVASPDALRQAIALAYKDQGSSSKRAPRPRSEPSHANGEAERVLIVDDEPAARILARSLLERKGYAVEEAGDGLEALDVLGAAPPVSLVVADLNMPHLDGLELIWEMRAKSEWSRIPVIVVTGETDEILETKLIEEGADDYIRKPLDPRLFLARVSATIRRAED